MRYDAPGIAGLGIAVTQYEDLRRWYPALPPAVDHHKGDGEPDSDTPEPRDAVGEDPPVVPSGEFTGDWADWLSDDAVSDDAVCDQPEELGVVRPIRPSVAVPSQSGAARSRARQWRAVLVAVVAVALLVAAGAVALHLWQARAVPSQSLPAAGAGTG